MGIINELKDDKRKLYQQLNDLANNFEDILAENRILRKMNNIPDNWGCEPQKRIIKLQDRETVYEYKRLVKILQEDNYSLEKERASLKHRIKQLAIYGGMKADDKYKDLTPDQILRVNQFVIKLKSGNAEEDKSSYDLMKENQELKKELDILQTKGYNVIRQQLEAFLRENKGSLFSGMNFSDPRSGAQELSEEQIKLMENMKKQQEQMKNLVEHIWTDMANKNPFAQGETNPNLHPDILISQEEAGRFAPPKVTGMTTGYSFKFNTNLDIPMAGSANSNDIPVILLQIVELLALNDRKDNQIKILENELERAYNKVRKYLLMQDQLYLNYVDELQGFKDKSSKFEQVISGLKDQLREEQIKNENYLKAFNNVKLENDPMANQIVNLQKKLALLEVENFRLAKKYSILSEQDKQLREAYHKVEEGFAEREKFATERIARLKEWQIKAINEIKFLYSKFRDAVPLGEYQNISKELFIVKQKYADMMEKWNRQAITNSRLQTENRELLTADEKLKVYEEMKIDIENELESVQRRLEIVDPSYKWENSIFNKVVSVLKMKRVSPRQIFDYFDKDGSGTLSSKEFLNALDKMGIADLKPKEKEILLRSIDADNDGAINYREFCRKWGRYGVKSRSKEDEIVFILDDTLKRSNLDLSTIFDVMDKNGKGVITKEDFKDTLISSRIKIDRKDLENFTDLFWKDRPEGINFRDFIRIYNRFKARFDAEQESQDKESGKLEITEEMVKRQKYIFDKLNETFKNNKITLKEAFDKIDDSKDKRISRVELRRLFTNMEVTMKDVELEILFRQLDFDDSGAVSYLEFEAEFNRITETPMENLLALYHDKMKRSKRKFGSTESVPLSAEFLHSGEVTIQTKYNILEAKVIQLEKKIDMFKSRLTKSENSQIIWERDYDILEKKYYEVNIKYQDLLQREQITNALLVGSLPKEKSEEIMLLSEKQKEQIVDLKAAMSSYKSLFEVAAGQAKTLKLANRRSKDEEENLMFALRELQSNSIDKMKLGRIYYILMLSRWQEAAVGMKYDQALNDLRNLRLEYAYTENRLKKEETEKHSTEGKLRDKSLQVEKLKQEIEGKTTGCISLIRAEEISKALQDLADEKAEVEEKYIKVYSELNSSRFKVVEWELRMGHSENMLRVLRTSSDSEISDKLIEMSEKLMQIRRNELRWKRESEEYAEKALYAEKRVSQQKKTIVDLEDKLADFEGKMIRKEEEWRRADNERQKKFFDAQFVNFETEKRYKGFVEDELIPPEDRIKKEDIQGPPVGEYLIKKSDVRIMEAKIKANEEEITNLKTQILSKERQLERLREWQLEDNLLSEDEKIKDIIESNKVKIDEMHEKESQEMAQAAYKTIKTLQDLIDTKNNQWKRKDDIIKELKDRLNIQKQQDTAQILKLNEELTQALKDKSNADHTYKESKIMFENREYEAISRRELEQLCFQKDDQIEHLSNQITSLKREKDYLLANREEIEKNKLLAKNDELANQSSKRVRALQQDVDRLTKELQKKEKVERSLNDAMNEITDKLSRLEQMKGYTSEDIKIDALVNKSKPKSSALGAAPTDIDRVSELDKMLKAKEKRLITTTQKCKNIEAELNDAKNLINKLKDSEAKLKEEIRGAHTMKQKIIDEHQKDKRDFKKVEKDSLRQVEAGEERMKETRWYKFCSFLISKRC